MKLAEIRRVTQTYLDAHGSTLGYRARINQETGAWISSGVVPPVTREQQARRKASLAIYRAVFHIKSLLDTNRRMRKLIGIKGEWR